MNWMNVRLLLALSMSFRLLAGPPPNNAAAMGMQQNQAMQQQMRLSNLVSQAQAERVLREAKRRRALEEGGRAEAGRPDEILQPQAELWRMVMDSRVPLAAEGGILVGCSNKQMTLLERADHKERWSVPLVGELESGPVLAEGLVLYANRGYQLLAVDQASGNERYRVQMKVLGNFFMNSKIKTRVQLPVVKDGRVYVTTYGKGTDGEANGKLYALDLKTGTKIWEAAVAAGADHAAVILGERILVGGAPWIQAFQISDGKLLWKTNLDSSYLVTGGMDLGGRYCFMIGREVAAVDPVTGNLLWRVKTGEGLSGEGNRFFTIESGHFGSRTLRAFDSATGKQAWERKDCGAWLPWVQDGKAYLADEKSVTCLDSSDGRELWSDPMATPAPWPPMLLGTRLLVAFPEGKTTEFHALDPGTGKDIWKIKVLAKPGLDLPTFDSEGLLFPGPKGEVISLR
jgi:outer membrane protein assembly factor BamB